MSSNVDVVLQTIRAVEQRDAQALFALYHPERTWLGTWGPLQPTEAERRMDPRVVAANDREVVVLYRQRGLDPTGERFDAPVVGLYEVHEGKFARAQMFHFDTAAVVKFLTEAQRRRGPA